MQHNCHFRSRLALLRGDRVDGCPSLLQLLAAAFRAFELPLLVLGDSQNQGKLFLAGQARELVLGHAYLSTRGALRSEILVPRPGAGQTPRMLTTCISPTLNRGT